MSARLAFALVAMLIAPTAQAAEIILIASAALKAAYVELLPQFEVATGDKVTATWSSSQVIQKRIAAGEAADVVIMADILGRSLTDELITQGMLSGRGIIKEACQPQRVRIIHWPENDNKAHAEVRQIPRDDRELLQRLASGSWSELVLNASVPAGSEAAPEEPADLLNDPTSSSGA